MALDSRTLKWTLVGLYTALVVGLLGSAYAGRVPDSFVFSELEGELFWTIFVLLITLLSQGVFLFATGTVNLCRPIRRPRLVAPVAITAFLMAVLVFGGATALAELFEVDSIEGPEVAMWAIMTLIWLAWAVAFFVAYRERERFHALSGMVRAVLAGSLAELLVSLPAHVIVSRRPGCMVGIGTSIGLSCGILVILWAFGPGIVILFLRERFERECGEEAVWGDGRTSGGREGDPERERLRP